MRPALTFEAGRDLLYLVGCTVSSHKGPVVKWYYAAFALPSREFDSRQVHRCAIVRKDLPIFIYRI